MPGAGSAADAVSGPLSDLRLAPDAPADAELHCPINADAISMRWMNAYVPTPGQPVKAYQPTTVSFMRRVLKAYAGVAVRGRGIPPFIHPSQLALSGTAAPTSALSTCLSLVRICSDSLAGAHATADAAAAVLMREMDRLYADTAPAAPGLGSDGPQPLPPQLINHWSALGVFQAYLLYALVLFFQLEVETDPFRRQAIVALQWIACASARRGLICTFEPSQPSSLLDDPSSSNSNRRESRESRAPHWAAWVIAEAKRRTLYTMYLFDSVLSAHDGMPTYLGIELSGLPAPGSKALWEAASPAAWARAYHAHRAEWAAVGGYVLSIDELWPLPPAIDAAALALRRRRVDQWLEAVDEYGMMMYAVTSRTHGG